MQFWAMLEGTTFCNGTSQYHAMSRPASQPGPQVSEMLMSDLFAAPMLTTSLGTRTENT